MIMVLILVTQNFAAKATFSYKNIDYHDHEAHDQPVLSPSVPPSLLRPCKLTSCELFKLKVPESLKRKIKFLKDRGVCCQALNVMACSEMTRSMSMLSACLVLLGAWCLKFRTSSIFDCTLSCAKHYSMHTNSITSKSFGM